MVGILIPSDAKVDVKIPVSVFTTEITWPRRRDVRDTDVQRPREPNTSRVTSLSCLAGFSWPIVIALKLKSRRRLEGEVAQRLPKAWTASFIQQGVRCLATMRVNASGLRRSCWWCMLAAAVV